MIRFVYLLVLAIAAACGDSSRPALAIETLVPPGASNSIPVTLRIEGTFQLEVRQDLDDGRIDVPALEVRIGDTVLADAVRTSETTIEGTVPAGLDPGLYDVVVTNGSRSARAPEQFAVLASGLDATLAIPDPIGRGNQFTVTMQVTNPGAGSATAVTPSMLMTTGTATVTLLSPEPMGATLAGGASTTFTWTYRATTVGTLTFTGTVTGTDDATQIVVSSAPVMSNTADVIEVADVAGDPLGDGSRFGYVVGYRDRLYIGPNQTGTNAARMAADGSMSELLTFTFNRDTTDNIHENTFNGSFKSIGYTGCTPNTATCGPDNEDGRGVFAAGTLAGEEWLVLGGASTDDVDYIYMTNESDTNLDFRYVDLENFLGGQTQGFSAAHFHANRLYLGFPDASAQRPFLLALATAPPAPGLDATSTDVVNLRAELMPNFQSTQPPSMIDSFATMNDLLYVANQGGIMASTVTTPGDYFNAQSNWANATPAFLPWIQRPSRTTTKLSDLEPADRAIPQMAAFGGHLFVARNTTTGPQIWGCNPAPGNATRCEPGDWRLVAPNLTGDGMLSQFDRANITTISMVVATSQFLYVGFDSPSGVLVFRTAKPEASMRADFEGTGGCAANQPTTCSGIGGAGLGDATDTRIWDAKVIDDVIYITVGNATSPLRLVVMP